MDNMKDLIYAMDNFDRQLNATKFRLAQVDILSESIKHSQCKGLAGKNANFALSSLCTKLMQFNAGLERLDEIRIGDKMENQSQAMTAATANKFIMYSILDEFKLNDSTMPKMLSAGDGKTCEPGYIGTGYISHIENELLGLAYIVDAARTPDTLEIFGENPKQSTHLPQPGEMFGYVFNEKYLVRAIRVEYESGVEVIQKRQYSAWLMDIGCTVRIDVKPTLRDHYEVTALAKTLPPYAKRFQLARIPDQTNVNDLLHLRIQYKVIFIDGGLRFVDVQKAGVNPFAVAQQNEWNFYQYYLGNHMNAFSSHRANKQLRQIEEDNVTAPAAKAATTTTTVAKRSQPLEQTKNTNPFLNGAYQIESIPMQPLMITKSNPFYSDSMENLYETSQTKQKFVNFNLNKLLNIETSHNKTDHPKEHTSRQQTGTKHQPIVEQKILNGNAHLIDNVVETAVHPNQSVQQHISVTKAGVQRQKQDEIENFIGNNGQRQPKQQQEQRQPVSNIDVKINNQYDNNNNNNNNNSINKPLKHNVTEMEPMQSSKSMKLAHQTVCNGTSVQSNDFPQPKNLPQVGDSLKILFQVLESLETFYATVVDDPERDMAVHEFSLMLNDVKNTQLFEAYGVSTPKLFDKVLAMYEGEYYRAKVISVIDEHSFQVLYVDYGNCAKVKTAQLFKYDNKWDKYPVYALRFRINGIEETNPWDFDARNALEQILIADCDATVVRIQYCEKTNRQTYVVDLFDENGMNVAETLVQKNLAIFAESRPKNQLKRS